MEFATKPTKDFTFNYFFWFNLRTGFVYKDIWEILNDGPKTVFVTNIDFKNKNDQNRFKYLIKRNKYTLISLELISLNIRV